MIGLALISGIAMSEWTAAGERAIVTALQILEDRRDVARDAERER